VLTSACTDGGPYGDGGANPNVAIGPPTSLTAACGTEVHLALSWYPEATQGGLFAALGAHVNIDKKRLQVSGDLTDRGQPTGVRLVLHAGGPAVNNMQVSELMRIKPEILLGQEAGDDVLASWVAGNPTVMVMAPFQTDPVVYIWDHARHPNWTSVQDIGQEDYTVFTQPSALSDYLVGQGILRKSQLNNSYDGSPHFLMDDRSAAVGGFSTNEVYLYRQLGVNVGYAYVQDAGFPDYRSGLIVRKSDVSGKARCLSMLVPILQRSNIEFLRNPETALKLIVKADNTFPAPYSYSIEQARSGVAIMKSDQLVRDGSDHVFGSMDRARVAKVMSDLVPVYSGQHRPVPPTLQAEDLFTNQFLDNHVALGDN
jgi:hypothetical protein